MKRFYLIRLDDACPTMCRDKWGRMEEILDRYGVKPMVGVIPHNEDSMQVVDEEDALFWEKVKNWEQKKWAIALHGYNHCYTSDDGLKGLNPFWHFSEFAGVPIEKQRDEIKLGVSIMREHNINPKFFFAPGHTFDENTLVSLREESDIRIISDTIALKPYRHGDFVFIPQFSGHCREMKMKGVFTFCFHPNTMNDVAFEQTESFIKEHRNEFTSFDTLELNNLKGKSVVDKLLSFGYFTYRKIRKLQ